MRFLLFVPMLALALIVMATTAWSQSIPEYDGVYLRIADGSLVKLNQVETSVETYRVKSSESCRMWPCVIESWRSTVQSLRDGEFIPISPTRPMDLRVRILFDSDSLLNLSSLSEPPISIVVRGASPEMKFLTHYVIFDSYIADLELNLINIQNLEFPNVFSSGRASFAGALVGNNWGCAPSTFKIKRPDNFTAEYVSDQCPINTPRTQGSLAKTTLPVHAFLISTNEGFYGYK